MRLYPPFPSPAPKPFAGLVLLASALTLGACNADRPASTGGTAAANNVLYVETNAQEGNAVLAYRQNAKGGLEALEGSPFATGGTGFANPTQGLGPDDTDEPLALSADRRHLLAVNQGSHTIAVFAIVANGRLKAVPGSPFPSGGRNPCSLGVAGNHLYVVNKSDDGDTLTTDPAPNYTVCTIGNDGQLLPVAGSTVATKPGASPAHAYVAPGQHLLFVDDFLAFKGSPAAGTLRAFALGADGRLNAAPGTPLALPPDPKGQPNGALGLWAHPSQNILYVGMPMQNKVGVYQFDKNSGALSLQGSVESGNAGVPNGLVCWLRVNSTGNRLYTLNSGEGTVSVFSLADPLTPKQIQVFPLKTPGPLFDTKTPAGMLVSSEPFHLTFSPDGHTLFVVSQHTNPAFSTNYNYLHTLHVDGNGKLNEPADPVQPPVPATARPQGAVSVAL